MPRKKAAKFRCPKCGQAAAVKKSIEVGNTFNFGDYYGQTMGCTYTDDKGARQPLFVASYGIGVSRLVGTIAEPAGRFSEEQRSKQPSIFSLLRALIDLFATTKCYRCHRRLPYTALVYEGGTPWLEWHFSANPKGN